ncbi:unnamed protein product, partial [Prorocentrum cordatum]
EHGEPAELAVARVPSLGSPKDSRAATRSFTLSRSRSQLLVDLKWTEDAEHQPEPPEGILEQAQQGACSAK